jgi:hypothetical protein
MLIRVSPQWQITIPSALRGEFGQVAQAEVRMERGVMMVRPVIAPSADWVESNFAPQGITKEVLWEAMRVIEGKRRKAQGGG